MYMSSDVYTCAYVCSVCMGVYGHVRIYVLCMRVVI